MDLLRPAFGWRFTWVGLNQKRIFCVDAGSSHSRNWRDGASPLFPRKLRFLLRLHAGTQRQGLLARGAGAAVFFEAKHSGTKPSSSPPAEKFPPSCTISLQSPAPNAHPPPQLPYPWFGIGGRRQCGRRLPVAQHGGAGGGGSRRMRLGSVRRTWGEGNRRSREEKCGARAAAPERWLSEEDMGEKKEKLNKRLTAGPHK